MKRKPTSRRDVSKLFSKLFEYGMALRPLDYGLSHLKGYIGTRKSNLFKHGVVQYSRHLTKGEVESYELVPLDPNWPPHLKAGFNAFVQSVVNAFSETGLYSYENKRGYTLSLTESTRPGVDFQVTSFDEKMSPVGHRDYNDFDRAVAEFWGALSTAERTQWILRTANIEGEGPG